MKVTATTRTSDPKMMAWDTEFWGHRVGRAEKLDGLSEWAIENTVGLVCLLVNADCTHEIQKAEEQGFRMMDIRLTLDRPTAPRSGGARLVRETDTAVLCEIARTAFRLTRFYADPRLDDDQCGELYARWTRSMVDGAADVVLVLDGKDSPAGYVTVKIDDGVADIGLIAVESSRRGMGFGEVLVSSAIDWAHAHDATLIQVATQARNIGALRAFERCGFRASRTSVWLHRWYT